VAVLATGGTIAMTAAKAEAGATPRLTGEDLVAAVPGLAGSGIDVTVRNIQQAPGASITPTDMFAVAAVARAEIAAGAAGVVVTQGTDTIEETAYFLDLVHDGLAPIVVTGAMRNPSLAGADGPANLLAAVQTAASATARGLGGVVVFGNEIHEGRWVRKTHSVSPHTFASPDVGPVGYLLEGRPRLLRGVSRQTKVHVPATGAGPGHRIALVTMTFDDDGELLRRIDEASFAGVVLAAFGAGHVPAGTVPILADLAARMPVVLTSRTGSGPVLTDTYGFAGSERDLLDHGLINAGFLHPFKARILLYLLTATDTPRAQLAEAFRTAGAVP